MENIDKLNYFDMLLLKAICSENQINRKETKQKIEKYLDTYNTSKKKYSYVYLHKRLSFLETLGLIEKTKDVITIYNIHPKIKFVLLQYVITYFELSNLIQKTKKN